MLIDVRRITDVCELPLLVDVDTGFGASAFNVARTVKSLIKAGAAAMHIEDQVGAKRCGHRPGKEIVARTRWSTASRPRSTPAPTPTFFIMARTDALAVEGLDAAIERAVACVEAGADVIFPEAITELAMYEQFAAAVEGAGAGQHHRVRPDAAVHGRGAAPAPASRIALYPLSAFRAMNKAAQTVYATLRRDGTQTSVVDTMQTREELYDSLGYCDYENKLDAAVRERQVSPRTAGPTLNEPHDSDR